MSVRRGGRTVLQVGAHVRFRDRTWQVIAVAGQQVHLAGETGEDETVVAGHLFADPSFTIVGAEMPQAVTQWGLFETAPEDARRKALAWQRHIREVETGLPGGTDSAEMPRAEYDPDRFTLAQREEAKAAELTAIGFGPVSRTTVQRMRLAYRKQGLWGLVDHRTTRRPVPTGRTDERVIAAIEEALRRQRGRSKGTVKGLMPLVTQILTDRHGRGTVPAPSQATFYRLVHQLADPSEHPHRPARTLPSPAGRRAFTPTVALRPGEQVQVDTTRLDVLAVFDDGTTGRPELTIAIDVATRAILAAVLRPAGTKAVDAALLLAEMAVPHPARPTWPDALRLAHTQLPQLQRLMDLDERLQGAAARPVVVPETIVVDRGKIYLSTAFSAACETLGISVQPTPPHAPAAKGIVERTFGTINALLCQHLPGYTGSNVTRRGPDAEHEACFSVAQLQDLLDEWLIHYHHRPHEGLRHPTLPKKALTPNQMWAALIAVTGYVPLPLSGSDYLELLPVRWQAITERGIRIDHRTYDHDVLAPYRGQPSPVTARGGKWEVHTNPHDARQVWIRLPDGHLTEIPWIHRDHIHQPFNSATWQHIKTITTRHSDRDTHEADLADALDQLMRRAHTGTATPGEQRLITRAAPLKTPPPAAGTRPPHDPAPQADAWDDDSIDDLDDQPDEPEQADSEDELGPGDTSDVPVPYTGLGLYDPAQEALNW
ncbi:Mu transposase C-terminal domain-containing protein [Streptomyces brevispora]|uniref:DDE-type integrase/transposase/recombinase n=1 Tax=Streptomyces brevispora TaxID=887462 RepID=A0ABZ1GD04_9ACTN|nr:Mu transposase C-terminal domain-containing protein [Streptomyces brevispora]WSC11441.1 DDE-type integrase/transposase/recombinase [Streptomyces brevispora]WSC17670.1 DDE-type integrase/transposase/recombinase [Streptomyces brevispora]